MVAASFFEKAFESPFPTLQGTYNAVSFMLL